MKNITLILLLLICSSSIYPQKDPIKWKEIPLEDLQMTTYPQDLTAPAVVLCDYGQYYFDTNPNGSNLFLFNTRHVRIKILNEEGLKYAKVSIPFKDMTCEQMPDESPITIRGMVYNLDKNGEIQPTRLKKRKIVYKDSANCTRYAEFTLPEVKVGSVIDYYYQRPTLDFVAPMPWHFQWQIPVRHSELRMRSPRYFQYMFSPVNFENYDIVEETNYSKTLLFTVPRSRYRYSRTYHFDLSGKQLQFVKKYVEAFDNPNFIYNPENLIQKLNIHLVKAINENHGPAWQYITHALFTTTVEGYEDYDPVQRRSIFYPSGYIIYNLPDWEKFTEKMMKSARFGLPLIKHWEYQPYLDNMIKGKTSDFEKMLAIYDYIRKNIKWNGEYDIYVKSVFNPGLSKLYTKVTKKLIKEKSLKKPFEKKEGSSSEINFILISLLNRAKIEAHPVIISTRDNKKIDLNIPDPKQFNHVLALVKLSDQEYLLDATDSIRPYSLLDKNDIGKDGFLVDVKDYTWLEIKNKEISSTSIAEKIEINNDLTMKQKILVKKTGYDALETRRFLLKEGEEVPVELIENKPNSKADTKIENLDNHEQPLLIEMNSIAKLGSKELKLKPKFNTKYTDEAFVTDFRKYPVEFDYPYIRKYSLEILIPDGFECILPKNQEFNTYGGHAGYKYTGLLEKNNAKLNIQLEIKKLSFPAVEYDNLAKLFTELNEKLKEQIIIRKKTE